MLTPQVEEKVAMTHRYYPGELNSNGSMHSCVVNVWPTRLLLMVILPLSAIGPSDGPLPSGVPGQQAPRACQQSWHR